jgi:hypothetical protein
VTKVLDEVEFQNQFHEAMREAEMADLKKEVDSLTSTAQSYANFDPSEVRKNQHPAADRARSETVGDIGFPAPAIDAPTTDTASARFPAPSLRLSAGGSPRCCRWRQRPATVDQLTPAQQAHEPRRRREGNRGYQAPLMDHLTSCARG